MKNNRLVILLIVAFSLLLIPFFAMQFTDEVNWSKADFIIAGILLVGTALISEILIRKIKSITYRVSLIAVTLIIVILIWIELAVGIFSSPFAGT